MALPKRRIEEMKALRVVHVRPRLLAAVNTQTYSP